MINKAYNNCFYSYFREKRGAIVCFHYESKKRHKVKVLKFLKNNHDWSQIEKYLNTLGLTCEFDTEPTRNYCHNYIKDLKGGV